MGKGGTIPFDPDLSEAKRILSSRAIPLYNKGGLQLATDQDLEDLRNGLLRRR